MQTKKALKVGLMKEWTEGLKDELDKFKATIEKINESLTLQYERLEEIYSYLNACQSSKAINDIHKMLADDEYPNSKRRSKKGKAKKA